MLLLSTRFVLFHLQKFHHTSSKIDTKGLNLKKMVHVQADWIGDQVGETIWLTEQSEKTGIPAAIVGNVALEVEEDELIRVLKGHMTSKLFRGVRQKLTRSQNGRQIWAKEEYLKNEQWRKHFPILAKYNLTFDAWLYHHQLSEFADFACKHPEVGIILNHIGTPEGTSESCHC